MTEDEMVGWHHQLDGREFEQALGDGEGQGSPVCCSLWGHKESDTAEPLNRNNTYSIYQLPSTFTIYDNLLPGNCGSVFKARKPRLREWKQLAPHTIHATWRLILH